MNISKSDEALPVENTGRLAPFGDAGPDLTWLRDAAHGGTAAEDLEKYRLFSENTRDIVLFVRRDGRILEVNDAAIRAYGYTVEEMRGLTIFNLRADQQYKPIDDQMDIAFVQGILFEAMHRRKDGTTFPVEVSSHGKLISGEKVLLSIVRDISGRKRVEEALRESEERFKTIFDRVALGVAITDPEGIIVDCNAAYREMLGYTKEELRSLTFLDLTFPGDIEKNSGLQKQLSSGLIDKYRLEKRYVHKDRHTFWCRLTASAVRNPDGTLKYNLSVAEDITERKNAEEAIIKSLKEKEVLLKEVHHRVKNNLQVISSLLSLQSQFLKSKDPSGAFKESQDRIRTMALIHEKLYKSSDFSRIEFTGYVYSLTGSLISSYCPVPGKVRYRVEGGPSYLTIENAVPCGLIANELITNSLKYAFPGPRAGEITITIRQAPGRFSLTVSDDGIGLPPEFCAASSPSLGIQLVIMLVQQLGGNLEISSTRGASFSISFPTNQ